MAFGLTRAQTYDVAKKMKNFSDMSTPTDQSIYGDANAYRAALEKAAYGGAATEFGQGLTGITNYLARSGPLADSGAGIALKKNLWSKIYGAASGRVANSYAEYLANLMNQRRSFDYQKKLLAYQKKLNKKSIPSSIFEAGAGAAGAYLGAPRGTTSAGGGGGGVAPMGPFTAPPVG